MTLEPLLWLHCSIGQMSHGMHHRNSVAWEGVPHTFSACLQGYLAHAKTPSPLGTPLVPRHRPTVRSWWGGAFSYEQLLSSGLKLDAEVNLHRRPHNLSSLNTLRA